ncbi:MAG: RadC family protein [Clostridia bacterium]|nr:RadC family protein [Clostridia bacterium]
MKGTNVHAGHREKMREKYERAGADAFLPHELLEMLLFYAVPYRDTNPTAHLLIERFGSLSGVLAASPEDLCEVPGIGEYAASLIAAVKEISDAAIAENLPDRRENRRTIARRAREELRGSANDRTVAYFLDNSYSLLGAETVYDGYLGAAGFRDKLIVRPALKIRASFVVLASCHASRSSRADENEIEASDHFRKSLRLSGLTLLEHFLFSGDYVTSLSEYFPEEERAARERDAFFACGGRGGMNDEN